MNYQENKERLQRKNALKNIKIFINNKKKKSDSMVVIVTKIVTKMVEYKKNYYRMRKNTLL